MSRLIKQVKQYFLDGFRSIHFALTIIISVFAVSMTLIASLTMYVKFSTVLKHNIAGNTQQTIAQAANTLDFYIKEMISVSDIIVSKIYGLSSADYNGMQEVLDNAQSFKRDIVAAGIYDLSGNIAAIAPGNNIVKPTVNISEQPWYLEAVDSDELYTFHPPRVENLFKRQYPWVVTLSRKISRLDESGARQQMLLSIDMNFSTIEKHCSNISIGKRGYMYIVDDQNNLIFHPQQQILNSGIRTEELSFLDGREDGQYLSENEEKVVVIKSLTNTSWKLVGISYLEEQYATRSEIISFLSGMLLLAFFVILFIAMAISRTISRPVTTLTRAMEEVRGGNFTIRCSAGGLYEVDSLSQSFNMMVDRINTLMEQIKNEEKLLRKSELRALQAQINPHFLYNTLDSIMWMCEQNEGQKASLMVEALATLFRISISRGRELITIREELMHAESYLTIQKMRYKDQFEYEFQVDENLKECRTLKILLQPMIENAIYHGIDRMVDKGKILIRVYLEPHSPELPAQPAPASEPASPPAKWETIVMEIQDNGLGMPEEVAKDILTRQNNSNTYGIGVKNVNDRIQIYFGKEYGLTISSELDEGTTVTIRIPKLDDDTYEH